jgi:hypothetical protein
VEIVLSQSSNYRLDLLSSLLRGCDGSFAAHNFGVGSFYLDTFQKGWLEEKKISVLGFHHLGAMSCKAKKRKKSSDGCEKKIISVNQQVSKTGSQSKKIFFSF